MMASTNTYILLLVATSAAVCQGMVASGSDLSVNKNNALSSTLAKDASAATTATTATTRQFLMGFEDAYTFMVSVASELNPNLPEEITIPTLGFLPIRKCYLFGLDKGMVANAGASVNWLEFVGKYNGTFSTGGTVGIQCKIRFRFLRGTLRVSSDLLTVASGVTFEVRSGNTPVLTSFGVQELTPLKSEVKGLYLLNSMVERVMDRFLLRFQELLVDIINVQVKSLIENVLAQMIVP